MKLFLAGIMQGSHTKNTMHAQSYRQELTELLAGVPGLEIYDPQANHGESLEYDDHTGRQTFLRHNRMCGDTDLLLAFVPTASMGTAIEMWEAYRNRAVVTTISPLVHNWSVKFCSHLLYHTVEAFADDVRSGSWLKQIAEIQDEIANATTD